MPIPKQKTGHARVLTSAECWSILKEKEERKRKEAEDKEKREREGAQKEELNKRKVEERARKAEEREKRRTEIEKERARMAALKLKGGIIIREYGSTLYVGLSKFPHRANTNRFRCTSLAS